MIQRILAMAWKEYIHIVRDFRTLYLALVMPVIMILLFGYAIDFDIDRIPTGVCDLDRSSESRAFVSRLTSGGWFEVRMSSQDPLEIERALKEGRIKIGLFFKAGFARDLKRNESAHIGALIDGSDNNAATVGSNYLLMYMNSFQEDQLRDYMNRNGLRRPNFLEPRPFLYFNPELKSRFYILPGIIALTMAILSALLTSLTIAREWERGSMEQLISTPVRPHEIILGKVIPYIGISLIQAALAASFAYFVFKIPFVGNVGTLFLASALFGAGALGLGVLLSTMLKVQLPAMQTAMIASMLPSILLSNFVFPIDSMPPLVRLITYIVPAKYFLVVLRTLFLKGSGFGAYWMEMVFLFLYALFVLTVASKRLKKRVA